MVKHRLRLAGRDPNPERVVQALRSGSAPSQRLLRLRLLDWLPSPHRGPSPRGDRGRPCAAAGRNRGGDALQPLLRPAAQAGGDSGPARHGRSAKEVRGMYDTNAAGESAPHTDYVSHRDVRRLFRDFDGVAIDTRNSTPCPTSHVSASSGTSTGCSAWTSTSPRASSSPDRGCLARASTACFSCTTARSRGGSRTRRP